MPATAGAILAGNEKKDKFVIPLTGVAIGNGLTAPQIQYGYYGVYAETNPVAPGTQGRLARDARELGRVYQGDQSLPTDTRLRPEQASVGCTRRGKCLPP